MLQINEITELHAEPLFRVTRVSMTQLFPLLQDERLTKEEILENWNMFVGSQATNYGEDLTKNHDEL